MDAKSEMSNHSVQIPGSHNINCCRVDFQIRIFSMGAGIVKYPPVDRVFVVSWIVG